MTSIQLHKEKGLNPFLTYCTRCHGEAEEIMLIGNKDKVYECTKCKKRYIGEDFSRICQDKSCKGYLKYTGCLEEGKRLPATEFCDTCKKEIEEHEEEVSKGGVYWKCDKCNNSGVIKGTSEFAINVRKVHNIFAPDPCGIDFTDDAGSFCPICSKEKVYE